MRVLSHLYLPLLVLVLSPPRVASGGSTRYKHELSIVGDGFFDHFDWYTENDPTHGRVNYLSLEESIEKNLTYATDDKFFMFPDSKNHVTSGSRGRDSNRITSKTAFDESVVVIDLQHMPYGCATWPAFWTNSQGGRWPAGGEIDIIEGWNVNTQNLVSLHTLPNCTMPQTRVQTGMTTSTNCDVNYNYNQGCGTKDLVPISYGPGFNSIGGGYYALARSKKDGINVWFWPRLGAVPEDVKCDGDTVDPKKWGVPVASFPTGDDCQYEKYFDAHAIIFDLTFCGDLAGEPSVWGSSHCSSMTCADFVDKTPEAFADAYWEVNSLRIYLPRAD